ncbi:MAG TPA: hypothetical protein DIT90_02495 [Dehalococcoidia bacterium]|nr:hypothetical protein [Dehalococcoidia bacterium]
MGMLEEDPAIQCRKEGVFAVSDVGEEPRGPAHHLMSDVCLRDGITWDWFPENWSFGNGVTVHKTTALPEYETVVHGTGFSLDRFLAMNGPARLAKLELQRRLKRSEGWANWEARWAPGTCPQEAVDVHLTWLVFKHRLPESVYQKLRHSIEDTTFELPRRLSYGPADEPWKYLSQVRKLETGEEEHAVPKY